MGRNKKAKFGGSRQTIFQGGEWERKVILEGKPVISKEKIQKLKETEKKISKKLSALTDLYARKVITEQERAEFERKYRATEDLAERMRLVGDLIITGKMRTPEGKKIVLRKMFGIEEE